MSLGIAVCDADSFVMRTRGILIVFEICSGVAAVLVARPAVLGCLPAVLGVLPAVLGGRVPAE